MVVIRWIYEEGQAMPAQGLRLRPLSSLAWVLKNYRAKHNLTQEQLANDLSVDVRTLRRYENGETILNDINDLKHIANRLGIEPERLGVVASFSIPLKPEMIEEIIERIWHLVHIARNYEARVLADRLVEDLTSQIQTEDHELLLQLAHAQHLAGYVKSVITRANETDLPFVHYQEMERIARITGHPTLINIGLTYQGDMLVRSGNINKGIKYLEAAQDITCADTAARGNGIQLLGRAYLKANRFGDFEQAMGKAEEMAAEIKPETSCTRGQYSLGTVYEEYGRSYAQLSKMKQAMDYLDKAQAHLEPTKHWEILIKTARSMALVHGGEIKEGVDLAIKSAQLCRKHGTIRLMERIYGVQQFLDKFTREIGQASGMLREALDGPIEY